MPSSSSSSSSSSKKSRGERAPKHSLSGIITQLPSLLGQMEDGNSPMTESNAEYRLDTESDNNAPVADSSAAHSPSPRPVIRVPTHLSSTEEPLLAHDAQEAQPDYGTTTTQTVTEQPTKTTKTRLRNCWAALLVWIGYRSVEGTY
ncbi:hypothetical protein F5Y06DRAFT_307296 [Hypoxylon sp. FL0890]|nr:hypothetical protein F5Y06DRAFT_307296 [Hypoxylon sp. FL0890]